MKRAIVKFGALLFLCATVCFGGLTNPGGGTSSSGTGSTRSVFASATCALDSNLLTGGGTDDTTALQALLDQANTLSQLRIVIERPARITNTLKIRGNTELAFLPGAGIYLTSSSSTEILTNYNRSGGTITDKNITIVGAYFNGNKAGQSLTHSVSGFNLSVCGLWFAGVDNLILRDVTVHDAARFAVYINNATRIRIDNYRAEWSSATAANLNDGLHFNGPIDDLAIRNVWHNGGDDAVGLNSDELLSVGTGTPGTDFPSFMSVGGINNVLVDGVTLSSGAYQGVRVLNMAQRSDNITIRNVKGTVQNYAVGINYTFGQGTGNLGNVLVEDVSVKHVAGGDNAGTSVDAYPTYCTVGVSARTDSLVVRNIRDNAPFDDRPLIYFTGGVSTTKAVLIDGVTIANGASGNGNVIAGTVTPIKLMASNVVTAGKLTTLTTTSTTNISEGAQLAKYNLASTADASGNGYTLTSFNTVTYAAGKVGNAVTFDGSTGHLESTTLNLSGNSFSIAGWIKLVGGTVKVFASQYGEASTYGQRWIFYHNTDNTLHFGVQRSNNSLPEAVSAAISTGAWHFFAVTYNAVTGDERISIDGGSWVTTSSGLAMRSDLTAPPFTLGADHEGTGGAPTGSTNCSLDAMVVYNFVITDATRDALYNGGSGTEL